MELSTIGTYQDAADFLKMSKKTIYKKVSLGHFRKGIYIGSGRFNLSRLQQYLDKNESCFND